MRKKIVAKGMFLDLYFKYFVTIRTEWGFLY